MKFYIFIVQFILFNKIQAEVNETDQIDDSNINGIAEILVKTLRLDTKQNDTRFKELKLKLDTINTYVIDKEKFAELLLNETMDPELNQTNFYKALEEKNDYYSFLTEKDHKSLIEKLKGKINRDDILNIVLRRSQANAVKETRRNIINEKMIENNPILSNAIDEILAEAPKDNHKFKSSPEHQNSVFWDPQKEVESEMSGRRIYHGERTHIRDYPFMASIHVIGKFWCGGVLYSSDLVITSSSCLQLMHNNRFYRENPNVLSVRIASNHSRLGGESIDALEVYFHPGYEPRTLRHNLAVIRTRIHIKFTYHRLPKLLPISHSLHPPPPTTRALILGWGITREDQKQSFEPVFLQKKVLPIFPNTFCKEIYGDKFVNEKMFCAGTMTTGEGACDHDAGGPAIMNGRLIGIISYGPTSCGYPETPTVFTLIGPFADWIESINLTMPSYYSYKKKVTDVEAGELFFTTAPPADHLNDLLISKVYGPTDGRIDDVEFTLYPLFPKDTFNSTETTTTTLASNTEPLHADKSIYRVKGKKNRRKDKAKYYEKVNILL